MGDPKFLIVQIGNTQTEKTLEIIVTDLGSTSCSSTEKLNYLSTL